MQIATHVAFFMMWPVIYE